MLSYQHAYHAGGPADVIKHVLWAAILAHLTAKPKPLNVYETHAGRGLYPVAGAETQKTPEYKQALARLYPNPQAPNCAYLQAVQAHNPSNALHIIPGSPAVAAHVLRPEDHLHLTELHPAEFALLTRNLGGRNNIHLHHDQGHRHIPPMLRRGNRNAVLIDPSYEVKTEYAETLGTVSDILDAAPQTTIMVWYPLLPQKQYQKLIDGLKVLGLPATWLTHYAWNHATAPGMYGTGQIVINMPYQLEKTLEPLLKSLAPLLKQGTSQLTTTFIVPR